MITKSELVEMDETFINLLANPDSNYNEWKDKNYIVVRKTKNCEVDINGHNILEELKKDIKRDYAEPDDSSWYISYVFDLVNKKKLNFRTKVEVEIF